MVVNQCGFIEADDTSASKQDPAQGVRSMAFAALSRHAFVLRRGAAADRIMNAWGWRAHDCVSYWTTRDLAAAGFASS